MTPDQLKSVSIHQPVERNAIARIDRPSLWHRLWHRLWPLAALGMMMSACSSPTPTASPSASASSTASTGGKELSVGMVLVGPKDDGGWNQAQYEGIQEAVKNVPGAKFNYIDKVNNSDRPNVKGAQAADDLITKGAKLIIFNSDDFKDDSLATAKKHPDISVIHASGDYAWKDGKNFKNQANLSNIMGRMEYGKMIAGCAAALGTQSGKIGYLGPLINDETRRYSSAAYLGAKYCWENYLKKKPADLKFKVTWIGFWFNIPGVTLDPTKVVNDYFNSGYDVVMSGIDTPEAATEAKKAAAAGKKVKFVHYDLKTGCNLAPDVCLGVPYYNWGLPYTDAVKQAADGKLTSEFVWLGPNWKDINSADSMIGFLPGAALGENKQYIDTFIKGLSDKSINLYKGPIKFQDGSDFVKADATATDQTIWYMPQLLAGMEGSSSK